ncbi:hypothetical protein Hanom_Chr15g01376541 [Helianthus anomalus]
MQVRFLYNHLLINTISSIKEKKREMASDHRSRNTILTCVILLLSIITLIMINHCEGSLSSSKRYADMCNGTIAECPTLVEEAEEFLMDNEEHRRILDGTNPPHLSYDSLEKKCSLWE